MYPSAQVLSFVPPLVLIGLVTTAGIVLYRVRSLALPISTVTATATAILPLITGVTLPGVQSLTRGSHGRRDAKPLFSRSAVIMIMIMVLFIYDTIIATLAFTHMAPPSDLSCHLERQWAWLFSSKNADVIRRIQDRHQCCGFNSVLDRAWPFPGGSHTAAACQEAFDRQRSCFGGWRQDEQVVGGLMLVVAVVAFLLKVLVLVIDQNRNPFQSSTRSTSSTFAADRDERADNIPRTIQGSTYHDDPLAETDRPVVELQSQGAGDDRGIRINPAMQPSRLHGEGNEWREV